jgi:Common central domain of tyrosinase
MSVRKNAKYLTATEKENLVRAFVMMKADPVPGRPYNWFDGFALIHRYIQNVAAPDIPGPSTASASVNFGHTNAAFGPWHRYFLLRFEQKLQSYVPGVMLPYWDWSDPASDIMVASFMGPNGSMANGWEIRQGYFAASAPGSGGNMTPLPAWWPAGLAGWTVPAAWGTHAGALRRRIGAVALPSLASIRNTLDKASYATFRSALESGTGVAPASTMHAAIHTWFNGTGSDAQMGSALASALDPIFYLHHANVDRLWAMWQMDGHGNDYPPDASVANHHRLNDPMYPWIGAAAGYSPNGTLAGMTQLPDFSGDPVIRPVDVMDHRALGYSYDTMVTIGIALDRTGSMLGLTPNPMTGMGDVSKWDAAKQGVAAFLHDCEAAYQSNEAYVSAGIKTFRSLVTNEFTPVFAGTPYGLIKNGGAYSQAAFDAAIAAQAPGGGTPLADALTDTFNTLVQPPFAGAPADERRYLALFTDGMLTSGSPLISIPNGSLSRAAVFAMGFGHPGEVDYPTLANIVAKGAVNLSPSPQVFHGENAGQIDKFFSAALAEAIGYTPIMDPAVELFDGEHTHLHFTATSAEAAFYITAQGMDFDDEAWSYQLMGPDGAMLYADGSLPAHDHGGSGHAHGDSIACHCIPRITARRNNGRLTLFVQRNNCDDAMWVGQWMLIVARRAQDFDGMVMISNGALLFPLAAAPARGPRYARLLTRPEARIAARIVPGPAINALDEAINSTNRLSNPCTVVVNVYARTGLRLDLDIQGTVIGEKLNLELVSNVLTGSATVFKSALRVISPQVDLHSLLPEQPLPRRGDPKNNTARLLAKLEAKEPGLFALKDEAAELVSHHGGAWHYHVKDTKIPGAYHFGVLIRGTYDPGATVDGGHDHGHEHDHDGASAHAEHGSHGNSNEAAQCEDPSRLQYFERILSVSAGLSPKA